MKKVVTKGKKKEVIKTMEEMGYKMEGFNDVSIKAGYFYAYKENYQMAYYFTIKKSGWTYTISQY